MPEPSKHIFVLGLDDIHLKQLQGLRHADRYRFHELFHRRDIKTGREDAAERIYTGALARLSASAAPVDAIVGFWDFPVSTMLPLLRRAYDLPSPSFEAVLKCEHKYWSRLEQRAVAPECVPEFCALDPFAEDAMAKTTIAYPFWIKPVKSVLSHLGFKVHDDAEFAAALARIRAGISKIGTPFNYLLGFADLPTEIAEIDGNHCIVESIISAGRQCTLEGYALEDEIVVYGVVDSIREGRHQSSFQRYQYPSALPTAVVERMISVTGRVLSHIGFTYSPFNIEFYWDEQTDEIRLLEINTRISKSHCPLFHMVDGEYHHQVMIDVSLGRRPDFPCRKGRYPIAAKFMWRAFEDALVRRVPGADEIARVQAHFPEAEIEIHLSEGARLSELRFQDSYSYEMATVFLGGGSEAELLEKYDRCRTELNIELLPVDVGP